MRGSQQLWPCARVHARTGARLPRGPRVRPGVTIRSEDLGETLRRRIGGPASLWHPLRSLWRVLLRRGLLDPTSRLGRISSAIHSPFDAFERASGAVARGNLKVFAEIGREFARYLEACPADAPVDSPALSAFLQALRPGEPPDGQDYLRQAFSCYQRQGHEPDPHARAGLVLLANLSIGLHEQTRLQPEIAEAVDAPLATAQDLGRGCWRSSRLDPGRGPPL